MTMQSFIRHTEGEKILIDTGYWIIRVEANGSVEVSHTDVIGKTRTGDDIEKWQNYYFTKDGRVSVDQGEDAP